ncbi:MAG: D-alanyl-D-alanine carboxypeptidase [Bacteroidota bacterium]
MKNKFSYTVIIVITILFFSSCGVNRKIEKDLTDESKENNYFRGLVVYNTKTGKEIVNYNGDKYFTPASNTKLFTFYAAYRTFKDSVTGLKYYHKADSLIIKGTADPSFLYGFEGNKTLEFLKNTEKNIYLIDEHITERSFGPGWAWDDYQYYYMPEKSLFPIYGNVITLNKVEDSINVKPSFFRKNFKVCENTSFRRAVSENIFYVKPDQEIEDRNIPFKISNQLVADILGDTLQKKVVVIPPKKDVIFKEFKSVAYDSLYTEMLEVSDNFIAEQLMLQVGNKTDSTYSVEAGISYALDNYLQGIPQKPRWVDGSGLSRYNLFTPESYVYLLKKMYKEIPTEKLLSYFPVGGKSGTLKNYYKTYTPYIFAKSGTLSNNYNLSGYLVTKKGTVLIFSFMNNHYMGDSKYRKYEMEEFFKMLYEKY